MKYDDSDLEHDKVLLKCRFRSTVTKTSKCSDASFRSSPFVIAAQPIWRAVLTSCPTMWRASRQSKDSSNRTFTIRFRLTELLLFLGKRLLSVVSPAGSPPQKRRSIH